METIFFQFLSIFFTGSSFSILWRHTLNQFFITSSGVGFSVWWERYSFIHIFFETIIVIRGRLMGEMENRHLNGSSLLVHGNHIFQRILHSGYLKQFLVDYKPFAFIQNFFLLVDNIILLVETIFLDFSRYSFEGKQLFPASGNGVFIKSFITTSVYGFWVNFKPWIKAFRDFFFCCRKVLLKLRVNHFSSIFSVPNSGSSFSG